jgi:hypothetical protein
MPFEIYQRELVRSSAPRVTITNYGRISINKGASKLLRKFQENFAILLWDKQRNIVGIQALKKEDNRTYALKTYGPKGRGGLGFSAVTFLNHINYDWSETRSYLAEWVESDNFLEFTIPQEHLHGKPTPVGTPIVSSEKVRRLAKKI